MLFYLFYSFLFFFSQSENKKDLISTPHIEISTVNFEMNNLLNDIGSFLGDLVSNIEDETQNKLVEINEIAKVNFENFLEQI
jgi:hypothetical protein